MFVSHESSESVDSCKTKGQVVRPIPEPPTLNTPEKPFTESLPQNQNQSTSTSSNIGLSKSISRPNLWVVREFLPF